MENTIKEKFEELKENFTTTNSIRFFDFLNSQPDDILFENADLIASVPTKGPDFMKEVIVRCVPTKEALEKHIAYTKGLAEEYRSHNEETFSSKLENYSKSLEQLLYEENPCLENYVSEIWKKVIKECTDNNVISIFLSPIAEALKNPDSEDSIQKVADLYSEEKLKTAKPHVLVSMVPVLFKYIRGVVEPSDKEHWYLSNIYSGIAKVVSLSPDIKKSELIAINEYYKEEENRYVELSAKSDKRTIYVDFVRELSACRAILEKAIADKKAIINDNIMQMQPQVGAEEAVKLEKEEKEEDNLYEAYDSLFGDEDELLLESIEAKHIHDFSQIRVDTEYFETLAEEACLKFALAEESTDIDEIFRLYENMEKHCLVLDILEEGIGTKVAQGVEKGVRATGNFIRKRGEDAQRATAPIKRAGKMINKAVNDKLDERDRKDKQRRTEEIIKGGFRVKLMKTIRRGATTALTVATMGPFVGAVKHLGQIIMDKRTDAKVKKELIKDMEDNLDILNEKIEDAKSSDDKQEKYALMRQKKALERELQRIKYGLRADPKNTAIITKAQ